MNWLLLFRCCELVVVNSLLFISLRSVSPKRKTGEEEEYNNEYSNNEYSNNNDYWGYSDEHSSSSSQYNSKQQSSATQEYYNESGALYEACEGYEYTAEWQEYYQYYGYQEMEYAPREDSTDTETSQSSLLHNGYYDEQR